MKRMFLASLTLAAVSSLLYAQQRPSQQVSKASIEIGGVTLHLGMTKADVAELFVGTQITKVSEELWTIGDSGTVRFKNQKLIFADRSWMGDGVDQVDALFGVIASLNRDGYSACRVLSETMSVPITDADTGRLLPEASTSGKRLWIKCGEKSVLILKLQTGDHLHEDVSERLGDFEPFSQ